MGCSVSTATVVTPETHNLSSKPTGTLIFAARDQLRAARKSSVDGGHQFGLNVKYSDIKKGERIGRGSYGAVFKAHYQGHEIALKELFIPENKADKEEMVRSPEHGDVIFGLKYCRNAPEIAVVAIIACAPLSLCELKHQ